MSIIIFPLCEAVSARLAERAQALRASAGIQTDVIAAAIETMAELDAPADTCTIGDRL